MLEEHYAAQGYEELSPVHPRKLRLNPKGLGARLRRKTRDRQRQAARRREASEDKQ